MTSYSFAGRINAKFKYENSNFVIMDGFLLQSQTIQPVNQIIRVYQDSSLIWQVQQIRFEDQPYRQTEALYPACSVPYPSHVPQIYFVVFQVKGVLHVKHTQLDPTNPAPYTYTEILTYSVVPDVLALSCTISIGKGMIVIYMVDTAAQPHAFFSQRNILTSSMYDASIGLKFCKQGYSGISCTPNCPGTISISRPTMTR